MSDNRPIGIFDSGLGGLTVAKEIHQLLPHESTIYIGDTARVPYGNRSPETIIQFSSEIVQFLISDQVKAIVVACATASSIALDSLQQRFPAIPIIGVVDPAAKAVIDTQAVHVAILGTRGTIQSKSFENAIHALAPQIDINPIACPLFVPLIEEGIISGPILDEVVHSYLQPLSDNPPEIAVLGCTHYPLITSSLQQFLPNTQLLNVGVSAAHELRHTLDKSSLESTSNEPQHQYFATDVTNNFQTVAENFLESSLTINPVHLAG